MSLGEVYCELRRFTEARQSLEDALRLAIRLGRLPVRILALCALGELLNQQGQPQESLPLLSKAADLASAARPVMMRCHLILYKANKELGQFESALLHCKHHYALKGGVARRANEQPTA